MGWFHRMYTRDTHNRCFRPVPARAAPRVVSACRQLTRTEAEVQKRMGLLVRPRLSLIDEELGRIVRPPMRDVLERGDGSR